MPSSRKYAAIRLRVAEIVIQVPRVFGERRDRMGVNSFREGIEAALPALRRYARALTRDAEVADDLLQDTLVRALRSEHLFHGGDGSTVNCKDLFFQARRIGLLKCVWVVIKENSAYRV